MDDASSLSDSKKERQHEVDQKAMQHWGIFNAIQNFRHPTVLDHDHLKEKPK